MSILLAASCFPALALYDIPARANGHIYANVVELNDVGYGFRTAAMGGNKFWIIDEGK